MTKSNRTSKIAAAPAVETPIVETPTNVETLPAGDETTPLTDTALVAVQEPAAPAEEPTSEPEVVEVPKNVLYVDSPIKKALFDSCVRPEFTKVGGKWAGKSQANLVKPWIDVEVRVTEDKTLLGRTFDAQKSNWNCNDSNWVNVESTYLLLAKTAREANNGIEVHKKTLCGHLEDLKKTMMVRRA